MTRKNSEPNQEQETMEKPDDQVSGEKEMKTEKDPENGGTTQEQEEIVELRKQVVELKDKYMRLFAEFDNYKKRSVREKIDWMKTAAQDTMSALLPVLDDFDRAKKFAEGDSGKGEGMSEGVELVYQKLYNTLKNLGLDPMDTNGKDFDPEFHEAITEIPAPNDEMKGKVMDTIEKGYRLNEKIIRHAKVVVGK